MVVERGDMVEIKCNSRAAVVDTVPIDRAGSRLMELASSEMCSALCPHCGAIKVFRGFTVIEALICQECGEGVSAPASVADCPPAYIPQGIEFRGIRRTAGKPAQLRGHFDQRRGLR